MSDNEWNAMGWKAEKKAGSGKDDKEKSGPSGLAYFWALVVGVWSKFAVWALSPSSGRRRPSGLGVWLAGRRAAWLDWWGVGGWSGWGVYAVEVLGVGAVGSGGCV